MADTIIALPRAGVNNGASLPIKAVDLGDGTYAIAANNGTASGLLVAFPSVGGAGTSLPFDTVALGDGTYALKTSP